MPANIFAIAEPAPMVIKRPMKTDTPLKAGELEPGKYGKIIMIAKMIMKNFAISKVGKIHSRLNPGKINFSRK